MGFLPRSTSGEAHKFFPVHDKDWVDTAFSHLHALGVAYSVDKHLTPSIFDDS